jgi:hypothetical protein
MKDGRRSTGGVWVPGARWSCGVAMVAALSCAQAVTRNMIEAAAGSSSGPWSGARRVCQAASIRDIVNKLPNDRRSVLSR